MIRSGTRKTTWLAGVFISTALIVLVAVPVFLNSRTSATITELNEQADPAEKLGGAIQEGLSHEVAAIVEFQTTGQTRHVERYEEEKEAIAKRLAGVHDLIQSFGPYVQAYFVDLHSDIETWHESVEKTALLSQSLPEGQFRHLLFDRAHILENAHRSARRLNDAIVTWRAEKRMEVVRLSRFSAILSIVFATIAVAAISMMLRILRNVRNASTDLEGRATQEKALRHVAHALTGAFTLAQVLRRITETAARAGQAEAVYVELIDADLTQVTCVAGYGTDVPQTGTKEPYSGSLAQEVLKAGQPRIISDVAVERERRFALGELAQTGVNCAAMVIPLTAEKEALGALFLIRRHPRIFTAAEFPHIRILADMASLAIHRARTIGTIQKMQSEEHFLSEAARILASSLDYKATLKTVVHLAVPRIADWCVVHLKEDGGIRTAEIAHVDPAKLRLVERLQGKYAPRREEQTGAAHVIRTGKPELYTDITDDLLKSVARDPEHLAVMRELHLRSAIIVPLIAADEILGALTLVTASGRPYGMSDLTFAEDIARHMSLAIQNARLYGAAERAVQARDEVLRVVSHDLRNPVSNIRMTVKMLQSLPLTEDKRDAMVEMIGRTVERMNRLIEDLVAVARVRGGQSIPLQLQFENPAEIINDACGLFGLQARSKSIRLRCETKNLVPTIQADRHRVLQVLSNLLDNAIKFTPEGGDITIRCEPFEDKVRFAVSDTGPGIEPQHLNRIFDLFWQAKHTAHLGAGFGLTISKAIVEQHGGAIWAESVPGVGTTVFFTLPQASGQVGSVDEKLAS